MFVCVRFDVSMQGHLELSLLDDGAALVQTSSQLLKSFLEVNDLLTIIDEHPTIDISISPISLDRTQPELPPRLIVGDAEFTGQLLLGVAPVKAKVEKVELPFGLKPPQKSKRGQQKEKIEKVDLLSGIKASLAVDGDSDSEAALCPTQSVSSSQSASSDATSHSSDSEADGGSFSDKLQENDLPLVSKDITIVDTVEMEEIENINVDVDAFLALAPELAPQLPLPPAGVPTVTFGNNLYRYLN